MLLLTRRVGETIIIGEKEVRIVVLAIKGNQVRLGIEADDDISIHREEVYKRILKEREKGEINGSKED